MILLKVACNNVYMFKDFELDFTYNKKINHSLAVHDELFPGSRIKVRKNLIIMGGNATGKTTFGKFLCLIANYIFRGKADSSVFDWNAIPFDSSKKSSFSVEFVIENIAYELKVEMIGAKLLKETLKKCKIFKTYNIAKLRNIFLKSEPIDFYDANSSTILSSEESLTSLIFNNTQSEDVTRIKNAFRYCFCFSKFSNNSGVRIFPKSVPALNAVLPRIDDSVESVNTLFADDGRIISSFLIKFKNGQELTVPEGDIKGCKDRLSHGTFEVIDFIAMLLSIRNKNGIFVYIDEKLAHMHSELEAYLVRKAFINKSVDSQLFFTTHNIELFQLNVPVNSFVFFKRNSNGFNEAIYPSDIINKNDRNLSSYYTNDYFGVLPDYTVLDCFFEQNYKEGL